MKSQFLVNDPRDLYSRLQRGELIAATKLTRHWLTGRLVSRRQVTLRPTALRRLPSGELIRA